MSGQHALVVATGRNAAWVALDGETVPRLARLRRMTGKRFMPVPGDEVSVRVLEDEDTVVESIQPRAMTLARHSVDGRSKTIAANVDMLVTVTSLGDPPPRTVTLDQLLAFAERSEIAALVVLTKPDRAEPDAAATLTRLYRELGYAVIVLNPKHGDNVDGLRRAIDGRRALLAGVSGVGKSTIFRALGGEAATGEVSRHGLGRQTTSAARLYRIGEGFLIDSPGVSAFGLGRIASNELASAFREMAGPAGRCRFTDCSHLQEPGCAIRAEVERGSIAASRYASFCKIQIEPS